MVSGSGKATVTIGSEDSAQAGGQCLAGDDVVIGTRWAAL